MFFSCQRTIILAAAFRRPSAREDVLRYTPLPLFSGMACEAARKIRRERRAAAPPQCVIGEERRRCGRAVVAQRRGGEAGDEAAMVRARWRDRCAAGRQDRCSRVESVRRHRATMKPVGCRF